MAPGIQLTLLIGPTVPRPAPAALVEALQSVEVTHSDAGRSGFQLVLKLGRSGSTDLQDYKLLKDPLLQPFNRLVLTVTLNARVQVLMDGIITNQQFSPNVTPGGSTLTITGEDVSLMLDLEEKSVGHPAQDETIIATQILSQYSRYGLLPEIVKPPVVDRPSITERLPVQLVTDLQYLQALAQRYAYVFYVTPGPKVGTNTAYWGPPKRKTQPQRALSVNLGPQTNVESLNFENNALSATTIEGRVQDRKTNRQLPVQDLTSDRIPLVKQPALQSQSRVRRIQFRETGRDNLQASAYAQAMIDRSVDEVVSVSGELDTLRYGDLLQPRGVVGLRGVGYSYDGRYYVKKVTHRLRHGEYKQSFTITREGLGTTDLRVRV
ncbi:phage late control D family protein [Leptolyngbya sp. FACHB-261]|uniref:phage late control D family protein n=1 Tax=Leptolyngbya sp. FACHB-261 TaxID=2692806 RepID=UPI001685FBC9|nr:hypothetical protein [Leptolyngbya sp. FACHB-261]MBD2099875.1 hypothetical protein [Leptolyngbya sp. FACHB-261]